MNLREIVDRLGLIKASLAELQMEEQVLVNELKDRGVAIRHGQLFDANIFIRPYTYTDWDGVVKAAKVPKRLIQKYRTTTYPLVCTVTARKMRRIKGRSSEAQALS